MSAKERFDAYERQAHVLKTIARQYAQNSVEERTLREAAFALSFALTERADEFARFVEQANRSLTPEERLDLARFGLR